MSKIPFRKKIKNRYRKILNYSKYMGAFKAGDYIFVSYPATLIFTADHDDRVVPAHSFKFAATMQEKQAGSNPILIRIDTNQGHGASGYSVSKLINEETDKWSFMFYNMGITPKW